MKTPLVIMDEMMGIDCYRHDFPNLLIRVRTLDFASRVRLITACENALAVTLFRQSEPTRVAAAKLLVANLPDSKVTIQKWLKMRSLKSIYEVHFSLFCYLDEVQHFEHLKSAKKAILGLVVDYLMKSRNETAQSAWMAADLLGDHWNIQESLSPLLSAAQNAKFPAARRDAVHGLEKALPRCAIKDQARIRSVLELLATNDRSRVVKIAATACLGRLPQGTRLGAL